MKKILFMLAVVLALAIALPASAAPPAPVGTQINILIGTPAAVPAGAPFHIAHGWLFDPTEPVPARPIGRFGFELEIDGVSQTPDFVQRERDASTTPASNTVRWVFNYPAGLTGTHTFTGYWLAPCQYAVDAGYIPGPCAKANEVVVASTLSHTVTFTP
jgi:hypothetical protein